MNLVILVKKANENVVVHYSSAEYSESENYAEENNAKENLVPAQPLITSLNSIWT